MKKLSKKQLSLYEHALDELYAFLKRKYNVEYKGNILCMVYEGIIHLNQCSCQEGVAWFADIVLDDRKIYISTRTVERETIYSEREYDLFYMSKGPKIHTIQF